VIRIVSGAGPFVSATAVQNRKCLHDVAGQMLAAAIGRCKSLGCERSDIEHLVSTWLDKWFLASPQP